MAKTIHLKTVIDHVNNRNHYSTCSKDMREGWNSILETMLMDAKVYAGFGYLTQDRVPTGQLPGVVYAENSEGVMKAEAFPDETRRFYYVHRTLAK